MNSIRNIIRWLIVLALPWFAAIPVLSSVSSLDLFICIFTFGAAWLCRKFCSRRSAHIFTKVLYVIGIAFLLWISRGRWLFPPAVWGIILPVSLCFMAYLRVTSELAVDKQPIPSVSVPQISYPIYRFLIFYLIWGAGLAVMMCIQDLWIPIIMMIWSCMMLLLGYLQVWPLGIHPEWMGYISRRDIFVPREVWRGRFIRIAIFLILCLAAAFAAVIKTF